MNDQGIEYHELETRPSILNSILWAANVDVNDAYLMGDYSFFDTKPIEFVRYPKNHHLLGDLRSEDKVERLIDISKGWFIITEADGELFFNDLRFGRLEAYATENPTFVFSYQIVEDKTGIEVYEVKRKPGEARELLRDLANRIIGN